MDRHIKSTTLLDRFGFSRICVIDGIRCVHVGGDHEGCETCKVDTISFINWSTNIEAWQPKPSNYRKK